MSTDLHHHLAAQLTDIEQQGQHRSLVPVMHLDLGCIDIDGRPYLNLAGNDYLGLATNRELLREFYREQNEENLLENYGLGSTASRLMTGNTLPYRQLEHQLTALYQTEAALVFNSGYHLNIGILPALASKQDLILADKLCHASLIDGMRLSRARLIRYPHLDYQAIEDLLARLRGQYNQVFIVTESIFSMDGDTADLRELVRIKDHWRAALYVDEAHGVGIRGEQGCGLAEELGVVGDIEILTGTFGKAFGGQGAFVVGARVLIDYLLNTARSQIFTTGMPPISVHWLSYVLQRIPHMQEQRIKVDRMAARFREALLRAGLRTHGSSNIVPVMVGDAAQAVSAAERICAQGYWVKAVRPPTVPAGTSRLRLSLNAAMDWEQLAPLPGIIAAALD
ncbi:aminotransferase class I/II-fold pyridoxal phosphate-dependent enzyme [Desulfobulbus alkaliphilus]|uniref:aminotransferase class I/II-fold pyridoxal phosphate-dependent enzyme n=1 Tax=Desulfobulbus alkaliphilus TaxID=869814 RepID=UPI00196303A9|nr:8-amino-7-oxononanoate synthase [Desulfobulbus alkaliphilus]MBM9536738.1 8-amino-7-oxononanoate synthase [Desulfobulbus alkaliphilus]